MVPCHLYSLALLTVAFYGLCPYRPCNIYDICDNILEINSSAQSLTFSAIHLDVSHRSKPKYNEPMYS